MFDMKKYRKEYYKNEVKIRKETIKYHSTKSRRIVLPDDIIYQLRSRFIVDPTSKTGLRWKMEDNIRTNLRGKPAGYDRRDGYYFINLRLNGVAYKIGNSHVVWMLSKNEFIPCDKVINHINRNPSDNNIVNLEVCSYSGNNINRKCTSKSGYKNVHLSYVNKVGLFIGRIRFNKKTTVTKSCSSPHEAFIHLWNLLTSGRIPLEFLRYQPTEFQDGIYLEKALRECKKAGISCEVKYRTLREYIASVESSC